MFIFNAFGSRRPQDQESANTDSDYFPLYPNMTTGTKAQSDPKAVEDHSDGEPEELEDGEDEINGDIPGAGNVA